MITSSFIVDTMTAFGRAGWWWSVPNYFADFFKIDFKVDKQASGWQAKFTKVVVYVGFKCVFVCERADKALTRGIASRDIMDVRFFSCGSQFSRALFEQFAWMNNDSFLLLFYFNLRWLFYFQNIQKNRNINAFHKSYRWVEWLF